VRRPAVQTKRTISRSRSCCALSFPLKTRPWRTAPTALGLSARISGRGLVFVGRAWGTSHPSRDRLTPGGGPRFWCPLPEEVRTCALLVGRPAHAPQNVFALA